MSRGALWVGAVVLTLAGCRTISLSDDPTMPLRDARVSPPKFFEVEWWRSFVKPALLEYQPQENATPAVDPDTERIIVATRDGKVRCVSPIDGAVEWTLDTHGHAFAGSTVRNGVVYVPGGNGVLYGLRTLTGEKLWEYNAGEELVTTPTLADGKVLVASQADTLYAVDATTGAWVWQYRRDPPTGFTVRGAAVPIVHDDLVLMGFADGFMVAIGLADGVARWEKQLSVSGGAQFLDVDSTPVVDEQGRLYVASFKDGIYALDAATGNIVWKSANVGLNALALRGQMLYATGDGWVTAFDTRSGRQVWRQDLSDRTPKGRTGNAGRPPMFARNHLVVPTATGLSFVDPSSGAVQAAWNPGKGVTATPRGFASHRLGNRLYVLSNYGSLFALQILGSGS